MAVTAERAAQIIGQVFDFAADLPVSLPVFGLRVSGDTITLTVDDDGDERVIVLTVGVA